MASSALSGEASDASDNLSSNTPSEADSNSNSEYDGSNSAPYNFANYRFKLENRTSTHHRKCKVSKNRTTINSSHIKPNRSLFNRKTDFKLHNETTLKHSKHVKRAVNELPRVQKSGDDSNDTKKVVTTDHVDK